MALKIQMINIDTVNKALQYLSEGYLLAKLTTNYSGMTKECLVAGMLMGLSEDDWWYAFVRGEGDEVCGLVQRTLFVELYRDFYVEKTNTASNGEAFFTIYGVCPIQEVPRYQRKIDSWSEVTSSPTKISAGYFETLLR
jgi:hypothetical protein